MPDVPQELDGCEPLTNCSGVRHWFDVGWSAVEGVPSLLFCHACGEVRAFEVPAQQAPDMERITNEAPLPRLRHTES